MEGKAKWINVNEKEETNVSYKEKEKKRKEIKEDCLINDGVDNGRENASGWL